MSNEQQSPWASGAGFGTPHRAPQQPPASNYTNPVVHPEPSRAQEPSGWSEPQHFGVLEPVTAPPLQFGQQLPYGYGTPPLPEHPNSNLVLTLGIVGMCANFIMFPFISPIAWYLGAKAKRELVNNPGVYRDTGKLTAGYVLGIVGSMFVIAGILLIVGLIAAFTLS